MGERLHGWHVHSACFACATPEYPKVENLPLTVPTYTSGTVSCHVSLYVTCILIYFNLYDMNEIRIIMKKKINVLST